MIKKNISLAFISAAALAGCASTPTGDLYWKYDLGADFNEMKALMDSPEFRAQVNDSTHYTIPICGFADEENTIRDLCKTSDRVWRTGDWVLVQNAKELSSVRNSVRMCNTFLTRFSRSSGGVR